MDNLVEEGVKRINWAVKDMKVLELIKERFEKEKPLNGITIGMCMHLTTETANLAITLKAGGANVYLTASNPLTIQDDVVAALNNYYGIETYGYRGENTEEYYNNIKKVLEHDVDVIIDDGSDLIVELHKNYTDKAKDLAGALEETTTGVIRLRAMAKQGNLLFPVIAVNDAYTKHMFDNRYGTGQSTIDGILRATNKLIAGSNFVVIGYGWCGKGIAMRARGLGAKVIVCEVDAIKALEAKMEGYDVMPLREASKIGDIFVSVTGNKNVIDKEHIDLMKDGVILANSGHFNVEINLSYLEEIAERKEKPRENITSYYLKDRRVINVLGEGRLVNLVAAEGHPSSVMDMSFANQALSVEYLIKNKGSLQPQVYKVPDAIDYEVAKLKLKAMNVKIDELTDEQRKYLSSWEFGTE